MNDSAKKYSIIMVTYNAIEHTVKCLKSLFQFTDMDFELIVVDNASTDGTAGFLGEFEDNHENVKVIYNDLNEGFSKANNKAYKAATGSYIVFLNNDTILAPQWLQRLTACIEGYSGSKVGAVGPVSCNSSGRQMVGQQDPEDWYKSHRRQWGLTGRLFGWCILAKREMLEDIGLFDENLLNGFEDNDLSFRAQLKGWKLIIAGDSYIHHTGQVSFMTGDNWIKKYMELGDKNQETFYNKYHTDVPKKLVAVYRTGGGEHLEESLRQTSKFADSIILHFCRARKSYPRKDRGEFLSNALLNPTTTDFVVSSDNIGSYVQRYINPMEYVEHLKQQFPKIKKVEFYDGPFQEDHERNWLLQEALKMQAKGEADWCISVDDDEIYEDKFVERCQSMMNPSNPEILGYWFRWRTIWDVIDGQEYFRADSTFGHFQNYRFFKLIPGQVITSTHPEGHHCGSAPQIPSENLAWTSLRVKHLGYDTPEQRQKKYEFYQANDNFKDARDIGNKDYGHLIDKKVELRPYHESNGISLIMTIKNEEHDIIRCLRNVAPVIDEFIIVDTGSTDKTKEKVLQFAKTSHVPVKIFDYPWCDNYSKAKNYAKKFATERWVLNIDADELFDQRELHKIADVVEHDVDIVLFHVLNYIKEPSKGQDPKYASTEAIRLYLNTPELYYTGIVHETLDDAISAMKHKKVVGIMRSPIPLHHRGYLKGPKKLGSKFEYYATLNKKQIEVTEGVDPRPFFNLALHRLNDDDGEQDALKYFQEALKIKPDFWHANAQMASLNIKSAKYFLERVVNGIRPDHAYAKEAKEILDFLNTKSIGYQKVEVH